MDRALEVGRTVTYLINKHREIYILELVKIIPLLNSILLVVILYSSCCSKPLIHGRLPFFRPVISAGTGFVILNAGTALNRGVSS